MATRRFSAHGLVCVFFAGIVQLSPAEALDRCDPLALEPTESLTAEEAERYNSALQEGLYQQVLWALRDRGDEAQAESVSACLEQILTEGRVLSMERMTQGISSTHRVQLERGVSAVFKTTNSFKGCYRNEIAAYRLDRRLDFNVVPMTVKRSIDGEEGSMQYFVADATPAYLAESPRKVVEVGILDILMDNEDRHGRNWLFYEFDGKRWLVAIDHNLTFGCRREAHLSTTSIKNIPPAQAAELKEKLEGLSKDELEDLLDDYIKRSRFIRKAQKARDKLIRRLEKLAAD